MMVLMTYKLLPSPTPVGSHQDCHDFDNETVTVVPAVVFRGTQKPHLKWLLRREFEYKKKTLYIRAKDQKEEVSYLATL